MMEKATKSTMIALMFAIAACLHADDAAPETNEWAGRSISARYQGSRTTYEINQSSSSGIDLQVRPLPPQSKKITLFPLQLGGSHAPSTNPVQLVGLNFTASTFANAPQTDVIPLNATGWVGTEQYILMSYQYMRSFSKKTGLPDGILHTDAASFFGGSASDVRIEYDRFSQRWYASCEIGNSLVLVVSRDSVIKNSTKWDFFSFSNAEIIPQISPPGSGFLDYNQLAIDQKAVYISMDTFDSSGSFVGTSALVIQKRSLLEGDPLVTVFPGLIPPPDAALGEFTPPADNFDKNPQFGYLIHASNEGFPSGNTYTQLFLYRIVRPGSDAPSLVGPFSIDVPPYSEAANAPHLGNLYGSRGYLQTGLFGGLMAPHVRDNQLFACHPIQVDSSGTGTPSGDRVGVRWYQIDLTGDTSGKGRGYEQANTAPVLVQSGTLFDSSNTSTPLFYYISSIMTNKKQNMVISATVSGANALTNVVFAGRLKKDPKGTLRTPVNLTNNTSNVYNFGPLVDPTNGNIGQRWGDESSLSPDPCCDLDIWSTGQWAAVQNGWGVQVSQLKNGSKEYGNNSFNFLQASVEKQQDIE